jgi:hypothetical protein
MEGAMLDYLLERHYDTHEEYGYQEPHKLGQPSELGIYFYVLSSDGHGCRWPGDNQMIEFEHQLRARYNFGPYTRFDPHPGGFVIGFYQDEDESAENYNRDHTNDIAAHYAIRTALEKSRNPAHFLPIFKAMKQYTGWFEPLLAYGRCPSTPAACLRQLRNYPRFGLDAHTIDCNSPPDEVRQYAEIFEDRLCRKFEELFNWDYTKPNDKLTDEEWNDLRNYINGQLIDLKMSDKFETILGDPTAEEKADENVDLKKAVKALNRAKRK